MAYPILNSLIKSFMSRIFKISLFLVALGFAFFQVYMGLDKILKVRFIGEEKDIIVTRLAGDSSLMVSGPEFQGREI